MNQSVYNALSILRRSVRDLTVQEANLYFSVIYTAMAKHKSLPPTFLCGTISQFE